MVIPLHGNLAYVTMNLSRTPQVCFMIPTSVNTIHFLQSCLLELYFSTRYRRRYVRKGRSRSILTNYHFSPSHFLGLSGLKSQHPDGIMTDFPFNSGDFCAQYFFFAGFGQGFSRRPLCEYVLGTGRSTENGSCKVVVFF